MTTQKTRHKKQIEITEGRLENPQSRKKAFLFLGAACLIVLVLLAFSGDILFETVHAAHTLIERQSSGADISDDGLGIEPERLFPADQEVPS